MTLLEREEISRGIARDLSARQIAARLGRDPSVISREIARNGGRSAYRRIVRRSGPRRWRGGPSLVSWKPIGGCTTRSRPGWRLTGRRSGSLVVAG